MGKFPRPIRPDIAAHEPRHGVEHRFSTEEAAAWARRRRLHPSKLKAAKEEFESLKKMEIIRPSNSQ